MSRFDDELRRAASQLAREPLPPNVLDKALDEPPRRPQWPALAGAVVAGVILVVGAAVGIGQFTPAPSASVGAWEASPSEEPDGSVTASTEDLGIRLSARLDRDRTSFGQRVWAEATVENLGPGPAFYVVSGSCPWPVAITAAPDTPTQLDQGRDDWPGDLGLLKHVLTFEPYLADRRRPFWAEEQVVSGVRACTLDAVYKELPAGGSVEHRAAWETDDYMGMPPVPGPYTVEVFTFAFWRGAASEIPAAADRQTVSVKLPLLVEGDEVDWVGPEQAIDALLSDEEFVGLLADAPRDRWLSQEIAFDGDHWVVTLDIGTSGGDPLPDAALIGVVDARTAAVLDVRREERHIALTTQPPVAEGSSPPPCPAALVRGGLVPDRQWGVALVEEDSGSIRGIIWPFGYFLEEQDHQGIAIHSATGDLIAHTDDLVEIRGGEVGSDGPWLACGGIRVLGRF